MSGKKRRYLDCDFDDKITIKIETHKKVKIEICDEPSEKSKLVVNPYAINNKSVVPKHVRCKSKRRNSDPPEIKIDVKRFKKENNCQEDTSKIKRKKTSKKQQNQQEQPEAKCTTFNVSSKTFQIKNCSVKIERCEGIEIPK